MDPAILEFLDERKEQWLKKKVSDKMTDEEKEVLEEQADDKFSLATWLPDAAKRAGQLSLVSHPGKFSHPDAKISAIIADAKKDNDGFLRTGNQFSDLDVLGNAAAMDVYKFLCLKMSDDKTILEHLEDKSSVIKKHLTVSTVPFIEIEKGLLAIKQKESKSAYTSGKVKQVYFPVEETEYHLLSIITPSSIMYKLKERINEIHFSDETKKAREARKSIKHNESGFSEIFGLSVIGYGGTKPQNISVLNSQNGGKSYLLSSMPPELTKRKIQPPRTNFFSDSLWVKGFVDEFKELHVKLIAEANNIHIRKQRDWIIRSIFYQVAEKLWMIRYLDSGWSDSDNYQNLPHNQKIWLDQKYKDSREEDLKWFESIRKGLARWFGNTYQKLLGENALALGDDHLKHIKTVIDDCEEALR
jgi:CRISPR-associated protein Csy1